jgi:hypothetical protein
MDYVAMAGNLFTGADAWAHAHPYVLTALAAASAHRKELFRIVVLGAVKRWPWLLGKEAEVLADIDEFRTELKKDMDEAAAKKANGAPTPEAGK